MNNFYIKERKKERDLVTGFSVEDVFATQMMKTGKFSKFVKATSQEDRIFHWDRAFFTKKDNKKIKVDVKGKKKYGDNYHTIELLSNSGGLGWIFGNADYLAFEISSKFIVVDRVEVIRLALSKVFNKERADYFVENIGKYSVKKELHAELQDPNDLLTTDGLTPEDKLYKRYRRVNWDELDITTELKVSDLEEIKAFIIQK